MRTVLSGLLVVCVTGAALSNPQSLQAQDEVAQLERDCDAGKAEACVNLGHRFSFGAYGTTRNPPRGVEFWEKACNLDNGEGCRWFGQLCQDPACTAPAYQKGCDLGNEDACHRGAAMHAFNGRQPDITRHVGFLEKGCDLRVGLHCLQLGLIYDVGLGLPKDTARANELFKKGCLFDNEQACEFVRR
jgi:TPR repeat protein